jgi:hypothetical protein
MFTRALPENRIRILLFLFLAALSAIFIVGCSQEETLIDDNNGEPWVITFQYDGTDYPVAVDELETTTFTAENGDEFMVVGVVTAFQASGIDKPLSALLVDFAGEDGFTPADGANCDGLTPVEGDALIYAFLDLNTKRLVWDETMGFPSCMAIKNIATIILTDAPASAWVVSVEVGEQATSVAISDLTAQEINGVQAVSLIDVLTAGGVTDTTGLVFDFEALDGFSPSDSENCADFVPVTADGVEYGYLDITDRRLLWQEASEFPKCLNVSDLSRIIVSEAPAPLWPVTVVSGDEISVVDVMDVTPLDYSGTQGYALSDVLGLAGYTNLDGYAASFEAADEWTPDQSENCVGIMPLAGDQLQYGYLTEEDHKLVWMEEADLPGCMKVKDLAIVTLVPVE